MGQHVCRNASTATRGSSCDDAESNDAESYDAESCDAESTGCKSNAEHDAANDAESCDDAAGHANGTGNEEPGGRRARRTSKCSNTNNAKCSDTDATHGHGSRCGCQSIPADDDATNDEPRCWTTGR